MQDNGSSCFQNGNLDKSSAPSWLFTPSQPLIDIRLPTYQARLGQSPKWSINKSKKSSKVWAIPISLATTFGIVVYFLFLGVLRCFSSPGYRLNAYLIQQRVSRHDSRWVSSFGHLRFKACLAAPRSLSQPTTSFIGILCQGIHCVRLSNFLR